ncbi:UNVERIFIED_CONTAM: hypothetical protein B566_EDAN019394 [Ephemera danica]|nr:hypothetical protein B566_EDAN019394 [Ephemera danica]
MSSNTEYLSKDVISNLQEMYEKTRRLIDEDSKNDPETDPYRSKYKAAGILNEMKSILTNNLDSIPADTVENFDQAKIKVVCMLGFVLLQLGIISYETEEMSTAEEQFSKCAALLTPYIKHPFCIITMMNTLNQLGILWSERGDTTKALDYLEKCESLYKDFNTASRDMWPHPVSVGELFTEDSNDAEAELEKTHTFTLYYLAQVYGALKEHLRSAVYCHNTLKRQLESKNFESIDWALNAATLSQFFATHNGFEEARHHLAAASTILDQLEVTLREHPEGTEQERDAKKETFRHRSADVARCWAKYGLNLLSVSQARLMRLAADDNVQQSTLENGGISLQDLAVQSNLDPELLKGLQFPSLELSSYEGRVASTPANLFEEARLIFLDAKEWLTKAQEYYTMDHHASDAVEIVQDMSHLYQNLTFFEGNEER